MLFQIICKFGRATAIQNPVEDSSLKSYLDYTSRAWPSKQPKYHCRDITSQQEHTLMEKNPEGDTYADWWAIDFC